MTSKSASLHGTFSASTWVCRPHTSVRTPAEVRRLVFTVLFHPPYDPTWLSGFHLFPKLKNILRVITWCPMMKSDQQLRCGSSIKYNFTSMELGNCWKVDWQRCLDCKVDYVEKLTCKGEKYSLRTLLFWFQSHMCKDLQTVYEARISANCQNHHTPWN